LNKLDIIIPTYNSEAHVLRTLESIQKQSYPNFKCILIDDNSTDQSPKIIKDFGQNDDRFEFHVKPKQIPKGAGASRQYGYELSDSPFVYWFDSDDIMLDGNLKLKMDLLIENPTLEYALSPQQRVSYDLKELGTINNIHSDNLVNDYYMGKVAFFIQSIWRRSSLERANMKWSNGFLDDWDFNLQAIYQGLKYATVEQSLVWYVSTPNSITYKRKNYGAAEIADELRFKYKWFKLLELDQNTLAKLYRRLIQIIKRGSWTNKLKAIPFLLQVKWRKAIG